MVSTCFCCCKKKPIQWTWPWPLLQIVNRDRQILSLHSYNYLCLCPTHYPLNSAVVSLSQPSSNFIPTQIQSFSYRFVNKTQHFGRTDRTWSYLGGYKYKLPYLKILNIKKHERNSKFKSKTGLDITIYDTSTYFANHFFASLWTSHLFFKFFSSIFSPLLVSPIPYCNIVLCCLCGSTLNDITIQLNCELLNL